MGTPVPSQLSLVHKTKELFSLQPSDQGLTLNGTTSPSCLSRLYLLNILALHVQQISTARWTSSMTSTL